MSGGVIGMSVHHAMNCNYFKYEDTRNRKWKLYPKKQEH